jgi:hypothetical protein
MNMVIRNVHYAWIILFLGFIALPAYPDAAKHGDGSKSPLPLKQGTFFRRNAFSES